MENAKLGYVLASVYNKKGIAAFCNELYIFGYKIVSTEGTGKELLNHGIPSIPAKKISNNPEVLDECIKTISFNIEASILHDRSNETHRREAADLILSLGKGGFWEYT